MGKHHTADERARIIAAVRAGLENGISVKQSARRLGITQAAFYRWVRLEAKADAPGKERGRATKAVRRRRANVEPEAVSERRLSFAMRAVAVVPDLPAQPSAAPLSLVAPGGYRIEGLSVESAAALLRALA